MFSFSFVRAAQQQQQPVELDEVVVAAKQAILSAAPTLAEARLACDYLDSVDCEALSNDQVLYAGCLNFAHAYMLGASEANTAALSLHSFAASTLYKIIEDAREIDAKSVEAAEAGHETAVAFG